MASEPTPDQDDAASADANRRRLLRDLARAGYAAPALVTLLATRDAQAVVSLDPSCSFTDTCEE